MTKYFYVMQNIGTIKYLLNYHDGVTTNKDGSHFICARCFKNKKKLNKAIKELKKQGYIEK